jgi:hypothetical protein
VYLNTHGPNSQTIMESKSITQSTDIESFKKKMRNVIRFLSSFLIATLSFIINC